MLNKTEKSQKIPDAYNFQQGGNNFPLRGIGLKIAYRTKFRRTKLPNIRLAAKNFVRRKFLSAENFVRRNILSTEIQNMSNFNTNLMLKHIFLVNCI